MDSIPSREQIKEPSHVVRKLDTEQSITSDQLKISISSFPKPTRGVSKARRKISWSRVIMKHRYSLRDELVESNLENDFRDTPTMWNRKGMYE